MKHDHRTSCEEFSVEIGGGSTLFYHAGGEIVTDDGGVHHCRLDFLLLYLGSLYWALCTGSLLYPSWDLD